jgi:hypothetical protein
MVQKFKFKFTSGLFTFLKDESKRATNLQALPFGCGDEQLRFIIKILHK